eukprot:scaffold59560_cov63-Phaeocystis_antarctica.AAC.3
MPFSWNQRHLTAHGTREAREKTAAFLEQLAWRVAAGPTSLNTDTVDTPLATLAIRGVSDPGPATC